MSLGFKRLNVRGENDMEGDLRIMKINICTKCVRDLFKWKKVVERARAFKQ